MNSVLARDKNLSTGDIESTTRLGTLKYVPAEAWQCSKALDTQIFGFAKGCHDTRAYDLRFWGTPLTPIITKDLKPISHEPLCPYAEYLVVRKEWEHHQMVTKLHEDIARSLATRTSTYPAEELIAVKS